MYKGSSSEKFIIAVKTCKLKTYPIVNLFRPYSTLNQET